MKKKKNIGIIITSLIYIVGILGVIFLYEPFAHLFKNENNNSFLLIMLILDLIFTSYIFIFSIIFQNTFIYKLYWYLMPLLMIILLGAKLNIITNAFVIIILSIISLWSLLGIINLGYRFTSLQKDGVFLNLKEKHPKTWWIICFFKSHLLPSIILFLGMLPAFLYVVKFTGKPMPTLSTWLGAIICVIGIIIQNIVDWQQNIFSKKHPQEILKRGLFKNSRHPDYFSEIMYWLGLCLMGISFYNDNNWVLIFSPIMILLLFVILGIPQEEKESIKKNDKYQDYINTTNLLLPFLNNNKNNTNRGQ